MNLCRIRKGRIRKSSTSWLFLGFCAVGVLAKEASFIYAPGTLKKMTMEELMEIEITLVSRKSEKLTEAASAIHSLVIKGSDASG